MTTEEEKKTPESDEVDQSESEEEKENTDDLAPTEEDDSEQIEVEGGTVESVEVDEDLENYFSDLLQVMRMDDPDYTVYSRYHIHVNHAIDLGDILIATILSLIFIHMFLRDFIRR